MERWKVVTLCSVFFWNPYLITSMLASTSSAVSSCCPCLSYAKENPVRDFCCIWANAAWKICMNGRKCDLRISTTIKQNKKYRRQETPTLSTYADKKTVKLVKIHLHLDCA